MDFITFSCVQCTLNIFTTTPELKKEKKERRKEEEGKKKEPSNLFLKHIYLVIKCSFYTVQFLSFEEVVPVL